MFIVEDNILSADVWLDVHVQPSLEDPWPNLWLQQAAWFHHSKDADGIGAHHGARGLGECQPAKKAIATSGCMELHGCSVQPN